MLVDVRCHTPVQCNKQRELLLLQSISPLHTVNHVPSLLLRGSRTFSSRIHKLLDTLCEFCHANVSRTVQYNKQRELLLLQSISPLHSVNRVPSLLLRGSRTSSSRIHKLHDALREFCDANFLAHWFVYAVVLLLRTGHYSSFGHTSVWYLVHFCRYIEIGILNFI